MIECQWSQYKNIHVCKSKRGTGPGVRRSKRSLFACHSHCKRSMETTRNSRQARGIKVMKLVESLIGWDVIVTGQGSEFHLTFVRERLHIVE